MLKKVLLTVSGTLLVVIVVIYFSHYRYLFKAVRIVYLTGHTSAFLSDYQYFLNEKVYNVLFTLISYKRISISILIPAILFDVWRNSR